MPLLRKKAAFSGTGNVEFSSQGPLFFASSGDSIRQSHCPSWVMRPPAATPPSTRRHDDRVQRDRMAWFIGGFLKKQCAAFVLGVSAPYQTAAACVEALRAKYPWPGPQRIGDQHDRVFVLTCGRAWSSAGSSANGKSLMAEIKEARAELSRQLDLSICGDDDGDKNVVTRRCGAYHRRPLCVAKLAPLGVDPITARAKYCKLDVKAADKQLSEAIDLKTACKDAHVQGVGIFKGAFRVVCPTYLEQKRCVETLARTAGVPPELARGCRVDPTAGKAAMARILEALNADGNLRAACTAQPGNTIQCRIGAKWNRCRQELRKNGVPAGAVRCTILLDR